MQENRISEKGKLKHKTIPACYEESILPALLSYPELSEIRIHFKLTKKHPVPYGTTPTFLSLFRSPANRTYYITLLEEAEEPERSALFRNLHPDARTAVIAHELVHVVQFNRCSAGALLKIMLMYPFPAFKRKIERGADLGAIEHGFGEGLYKHAVYLRSIPGYLLMRPELNKYYLKPDEILERIRNKIKSKFI
jgi:hypothetical protein